jgi:GT2 family glycosyltransferase
MWDAPRLQPIVMAQDSRQYVMRRMMHRIDVIVPCYNYGRYLSACVNSALSQEDCDVRVLIIDDCSTDDSLVLAQAVAATEPRVTLRPHSVNRGHIATYNEGIDWVTAPYMLLLSADDLVAPGAFARAIALMEANPSVSFVYGSSIHFSDQAGPPAASTDLAGQTFVRSGAAYIRAQCNDPGNPVETATAIVRTRCQKEVGHYRANLPHAGDMEMWLRLAAVGDVGFVESLQAFVRMHATNMRTAYGEGLVPQDFHQRIAVFDEFFAAHAARIPHAARLKALALRRLAAQMLRLANQTLERNPDANVDPLLALVRAIVPGPLRHPLMWRFHARRLAGPRLWRMAKRTRDVVRDAVAAR